MIPLILSQSTIGTYLDCHYRYYLSEVVRLPRVGTVAQAIGVTVHATAEAMWGGADVTVQDEVLVTHLDLPPDADEDLGAVVTDALAMMDAYRDAMDGITPIMVEQPFLVNIDGTNVSGIIDMADDQDDLHDTKTTAGKTIAGRKPSFRPENYRLQLTLYRWGFKHLTGRWPRRLLLDVVTRTGKFRQYELAPDVTEALDVLGLVRDGITSEDWEPTGAAAGRCEWCPYVKMCKYAVV